MATSTKKMKVFDKEELTPLEKSVAKRLGITHTLTNNATPASKVELLKIFVLGVGIVDMLIAAGQYDMVLYLFEFLGVKDFVRLAAAANSNIVPMFWSSTSAIFKRFRHTLFTRLKFHDLPDTDRLAGIASGTDLLREYRIFKKPKLDWKIDTSFLLPKYQVSSVAFNPQHPLVAVVSCKKIYILAYGGEARAVRGQILFGLDKKIPYEPQFRCVNWSPTGQYLLCLMGAEVNRPYEISVLKYDEETFEVHEIDFGSNTQMTAAMGMNTKFLWLDKKCFLFATGNGYNLTKIKLRKNNTFDVVNIDLSDTMNELKFLKRRTLFLPPFVACLFVLPNPTSPYIFFLTSCAENHQHHRILYVDKMTLKIAKVVNVPGEVTEISAAFDYFLLIFKQRAAETFADVEPYMSTIDSSTFASATMFSRTSAEDQHSCGFPPPERSSRQEFSEDSTRGIMIKCTNEAVCNWRNQCCGKINGVMASSIHPDSNKKHHFQADQLNTICSADSLFTTDDFIYFVNHSIRSTTVMGAHHHFRYVTDWDEDFIFLPTIPSLAWFHPKSHILLRRKNSHSFDLFLTQIASDEDRITFPQMTEYLYKKKLLFARN